MAGLENLVQRIYHERQQSGSMLCAQHALNNLLQGNYFTAPDLSDIARNLDLLERSYDADHTGSTNMDDTGFFSIQVLENALNVLGLNLVRWRGEDMRSYQDRPHTQLAFILNLDQHWFTLRRFGHAEPNFNLDVGNGHWFNLNSSLTKPEWVGKLYLRMVLQQAEIDGYSVFAVIQMDTSAPLALPRTEVDEIASTLPEPTFPGRPNHVSPSYKESPTLSSTDPRSPQMESFEDEDYELQAALQASLAGSPHGTQVAASMIWSSATPILEDHPGHTNSTTQHEVNTHVSMDDASVSAEELDPIAASMERNKKMLKQMQEQQQLVQRELWEGSSSAEDSILEARRDERRRREGEEAEQLRRAIEESEALVRAEGRSSVINHNSAEDVNVAPEPRGSGSGFISNGSIDNNRVYDDDDAELQAALEASLGHAPLVRDLRSQQTHLETESTPPPLTSMPPAGMRLEHETETDDVRSMLSAETSDNPSSDVAPVTVSVDELRRRRLARFGN